MKDKDLKKLEGRWYLQFSGSPFWQKENFSIITFNFNMVHKGEELVLEDRVEYMKNGKMRFRLGYDYPIEEFERTFKWKGKGINRFFRNRFEISYLEEDFLVIFYEETILSATCLDIVTRKRKIDEKLEDRIFSLIAKNETISQYLADVERIDQGL